MNDSFPFEAETAGVRVSVRPMFLADQSDPAAGQFAFAYTIRIENRGPAPVQLLHRTWRITDEMGVTQEVSGPGVVGEQPRLQPGAAFEYTSGVALRTPSGVMVGTYEMAADDGARFWAHVPAFALDSPFRSGKAN